MTDLFLDRIRDDLVTRSTELQPLIEEYDRIQEAIHRLGKTAAVVSLQDRIAALVQQNPGVTTTELAVGIKARRVMEVLEGLETAGRVRSERVHKKATRWYPVEAVEES
jgi:hypothetical protein